MPYQFPDLGYWQVQDNISSRSHALGKIEPKLGVGHGIHPRHIRGSFFVTHVGQHRSPQLTFVQPNREFSQVAGECFDVMVVLAGIFAEVLARQLTRRPRLVEWMAKQVVLGDRRFQLSEKLSAIHDGLLMLP
jgi:hypothetical protein